MIFHRHEWGEVGRVYMPPEKSGALEISYAMADETVMTRLLHGVTVIEEHCQGCGKTREVLLTGNHAEGAAS